MLRPYAENIIVYEPIAGRWGTQHHLSQQYHLFGESISVGLQGVEKYAGGAAGGIPDSGMITGRFDTVEQVGNPAAEDIVDIDSNIRLLVQRIFDCGRGVEWIRIILRQVDRLRQSLQFIIDTDRGAPAEMLKRVIIGGVEIVVVDCDMGDVVAVSILTDWYQEIAWP